MGSVVTMTDDEFPEGDKSLSNKSCMMRLYFWWRDQSVDASQILSPALVFDDGLNTVADEFVWGAENKGPARDTVLLDCFETDTQGALVFDVIDPVTRLRYRVSWVARIREDRIERLLEIVASL